MNSKTIKVSNSEQKTGKYGPSLKVGVKTSDGWENYYVNDASIFGLFEKGSTVTVEYEEKNGYNVIKGASPAAPAAAKEANKVDDDTRTSIETQICAKGAFEIVCHAIDKGLVTTIDDVPGLVVGITNSIHAGIFVDRLDEMVNAAREKLNAEEDIPF